MPEEKPRRKSTKQSLLAGPDGTPFLAKHVPKFVRDTLRFAHGVGQDQALQFDPSNPLGREHLVPGPNSPICIKCKLCTFGATNPFLPYEGSEQPEIVVITEQVSAKEDGYAQVGHGGPNLFMRRLLTEQLEEIGMSIDCVRWLPITRCAAITGKRPNFRTHGNWCRLFLVQELQRLKPKIILAVGSTVLGLLCHKSSAQDWGGRVLTWRGWPDDWLTDPDYMLPRVHPSGEGEVVGHPIMGQPPEGVAIPLFPVQSPKLVYATQNPGVIKRWKGQVKTALELAKSGFTSPVYDRKWFKITEDPAEIKQELKWLIDHPGTLTCFDTETTGLKPFGQNQTIVFMMFRWEDDKGKPRSIGFPWDYDGSALRPHINDVSPVVLEALYASRLVGHNLTFDVLFTYANVPGCDLERLTNAAVYDTWHIAYVSRQQTGSLGLDLIAYDWCKDMAGYEEAMTMLIELHRDRLDPGAGKGGHYANCPRDKWDTHLKPYVMGDVEVCYQAYKRLNDRLDACKTYAFPLAHPTNRGRFRTFRAPSRRWVYDKVVGPAAQVLARMMGRGLYVDQDELASQEDLFPKKIIECRNKIKSVTPAVEDWCRQMEATEPGWSFDPESKDHLKTVLYDILKLPVKRLTEAGKKLYSDDTPQDLAEVPPDDLLKYAALDKFTLNMLSVDHPEVRPLQEYRKVFKLYSTYVRTMRNFYSAGIDKREREKDQHLMRDGMVHTTFKIPGTRGGRLCVSRDTRLEVYFGLDFETIEIGSLIDTMTSRPGSNVTIFTHLARKRRIKSVFFKGVEEMILVKTDRGNELKATRGHLILGESGWIHVGDIRTGTRLVSSFSGYDTVVSLAYIGNQEVWDIEVEEDHSYVAHGLVHHNSSSDPNVQQIPRDGLVKRLYTSRFGEEGCILGYDLSQIELRLLAAACGDKSMVAAYHNGVDLHSLTQSNISGKPYEECTNEYVAWLQKNNRDKEGKQIKEMRKIAKCVDPDTLVSVDGRVIRIGDIHPGRDEDTFYPIQGKTIQGPSGRVVLKSFYSGGSNKKRLLVCTRRGLVVCSEDHPLLLKSGKLVQASQVRRGHILSDPTIVEAGNDVETHVLFDPFGKSPVSGTFQVVVNTDLAYVLGLFYGDGCSNEGKVSIATGGRQEFFDWQDVISDSAKKVGLDPRVIRTNWDSSIDGPSEVKSGPCKGTVLNGSSGEVVLGSTRVSDLFIQLGAICDNRLRSRSLKIPVWMFNASEELRMSFLAGWFDTDGSSSRGGMLCGLTKSWVFAQDLCVLMNTLGIRYALEPSWNKTYKRWYFRINVSVADSARFKTYMRHPDKVSNLKEPKYRYKKQQPNLVTRVIKLEPGVVADVEVNTEEHLFLTNGHHHRRATVVAKPAIHDITRRLRSRSRFCRQQIEFLDLR